MQEIRKSLSEKIFFYVIKIYKINFSVNICVTPKTILEKVLFFK